MYLLFACILFDLSFVCTWYVFLPSVLTEAFNKDADPKKVSLGVGAYRGDDGKPFVLNTVRKAEKIVLEKAMNHEYAGIAGEPAGVFTRCLFTLSDVPGRVFFKLLDYSFYSESRIGSECRLPMSNVAV